MKKVLITVFFLLIAILAVSSCEKECVHSWKLPTCETPKHCSICGATEGEPKTHVWTEATCETPSICKNCNLENGKAKEHEWSSIRCDEVKHCLKCGKEKNPSIHTWSTNQCLETPFCVICAVIDSPIRHIWSSATCEDPRFCETCGISDGEPAGHKYQATTCTEPKVCTVCNKSTTEDLPHKWEFKGCNEYRVCAVCSQTEETPYGHNWKIATCNTPKTCKECGITEGEKLGHNWEEATCEHAKTCQRCFTTEGKPLEHKWSIFENIEPTCVDGVKKYSCSGCKGNMEIVVNAIVDYHICDENGKCTTCMNVFESKDLTLIEVLITNKYSVSRCGVFECNFTPSKIYKPVTYQDIGMPVVDLGGILPTYKNDYKDTVEFTYNSADLNFSCYAQINVQGASSAGKPKKNFNIKLVDESGNKNKIELVNEWGKESKYCMKANYIDYSQSRNVVSGRIFGEIVKSRNDELKDTPNGGAIDGYPILVYNNGVYHGIYTMNIPKDNWMFDMSHSDEKNQAIFMTTTWNNAVSFREISTNGFELEYASNEDSEIDNDTKWAYDSMLDLIRFVYNNNGDDFVNGIHEYADIDKCIDSMLYTFFICADDNTSKNILWVTLDGKVWFSSMYDMDGTWGMRWNGYIEFNENTHPISALKDGMGLAPERNPSNYNLLWQKIYLYFFDRVCERYMELRQEILTMENITNHFTAFFNDIPDIVREAERNMWWVPSQDVDHLEQILTFAEKRLEVFDRILIPETTQT